METTAEVRGLPSAPFSRRRALATMLGGWPRLPALLSAASPESPVRLAVSESLVTGVNINDARAATLIWLKQMMVDLNVTITISPNVFETTEEILRRARAGLLDSVALNILEYRQIAEMLDPSVIMAGAGNSGTEQYLLLAKRQAAPQPLASLRGARLCILKTAKMCVAPAWLSNTLEARGLGSVERFFSAATVDTKVSRVVLPVFFGQAETCLTSKSGFDTMCELNPQVAKDLAVIAMSSPMVVSFYIFHKNYRDANRDRFVKVLSGVRTSAAGRQLATLFQFDELVVRDATCLAVALGILETAERAHGKPSPDSRKDRSDGK